MASFEKPIVLTAFLIRLVIPVIIPGASPSLQESVELSTLVTSFKSLKEGVFLSSNGIDIYDGGVVHHLPLLIKLLDLFQGTEALLYPLIDAIITYLIIQISHITIKKQSEKYIKLQPWSIGLVYALNPIGVLSNIGRSTVLFNNLFIAGALYNGLKGNVILSALSLAISSYLSYTPLFLVLPLGKLVSESKGSVHTLLLTFISTVSGLLYISFKITGDSWRFLLSTYGVLIKFNKIAPNMGLWWYYFTEMFEFFIPFYTLVFNLFNIAFIVPFTARLDGTFAFVLSFGWLIFGKPYAEVGDLTLYLNLLLLFQPVFPYLTYTALSGLLLLHSIILAPIFYHLWIDLGSGNSNFFYAISLVYSLGVASTVADFTWGFLAKEYHESNKFKNISKKLTQI